MRISSISDHALIGLLALQSTHLHQLETDGRVVRTGAEHRVRVNTAYLRPGREGGEAFGRT